MEGAGHVDVELSLPGLRRQVGEVTEADHPGDVGHDVEAAVLRDRFADASDFTFVFVPYCTGDVHGGNNVATYVGTLKK